MKTNHSSDVLAARPQGFLITGIGASAGGIQALREFFEHVPEDSGIAYVVILHLSPDHDSRLAEVLQTTTTIPVFKVTQKTKIEPDHIYVVPPNQHLIMEDSYIMPSINLHVEERRAPVDIFFRTLANSHGPRAICVVLSGTGANGSMGLKRIKEMGGVAYVQNPREAEFNEMPRNAIATELVDEVLSVAEIPSKIIAYRNSIGTIEIAVEAEQRPEQQQKALREIFTLLRVRTGHDFSNYKRPTLLRRIERRINIRALPDLPSYAAFLHQNLDEAHALLKDLLISVTNFFRDKKPFETLEQDIVPVIFNDKKSDNEVRVWVAGCATGEEAYSIAMLMAERTAASIDAPKVQIFATDIDESAITTAREGLYTLNDAADVSPERLMRFFNKEGDFYRVKREIREMIVFATHNFLKDPPFSRLDLVSCRNVFIYLNSTAQERVTETFHFALKPGGFLFLGTAESVDGASDLYAIVNRENHIYKAREVAVRNYPVPVSVPNLLSSRFEQPKKTEDGETKSHNHTSFGELHQKLLEQYAPPSVVVNEEYDIVHMSERVGRFFEFSGGEPTQNLLKLIKPELRIELRALLYQSLQRGLPVEAKNIAWANNGERHAVNLKVRPVTKEGDDAKGFILVIFDENHEVQEDGAIVIAADDPVAKQLENELINVKSQLKSSVEQHEYQAEELKASNEELQAMNEELRSAAEELETSKEELQSMNEELRTVNQELKIKLEEMSVTGNNLQNLVNSANVGTIFLDRHFNTRLYTPAILEIFNLIPSDYGRPISDITHKLLYDHLLQDAETVLEKLTIVEREVTTSDHRSFMMRILPYRTNDDRINGIVITFFDITTRKEAEKASQQSEERLRLLIESAKDYAIYTIDTDRQVVSWSTGAQLIVGYTEAEIIGKSGDIIFISEDRDKNAPEAEVATAQKTGRAENERWHLRKDGSRFWGSGSTHPLTDEQGQTNGYVKIMRDLTERKEAEEALRISERRFRTLTDAVPQVIWTNGADGEADYFNQRWYEYSHLSYEQSKGLGWQAIVHPHDAATSIEKWHKALAAGKVFDTEYRLRRQDGVYCWFIGRNVPLWDDVGKVVGWFGSATEIENLKKTEEALSQSEARLKITMESATDYAIITMDTERRVERWSKGAAELLGYTEAEMIGSPADIIFTEEDRKAGAPEKEMKTARDRGRATDERWHQRKDGSRFFVSGVMQPIQSNALTGYVKVMRDMTQQQLFTEDLTRLVNERTRELQSSNEDLRQFAHVASHDLKEPVRKVKTFNHRLMDEFGDLLPEKAKLYISKIDTSADRMVSMIEGVLAYSMLGRVDKTLARVELKRTINEIESVLEVLIQKKNATITTTELPTIKGNPTLIFQLFYNLILNSLKFAKKDEPAQIKLSSEVVQQAGASFVKITHADNGIGFEAEFAEEIFQTFSRLNPLDEYEGTGLGLALCKKIVERHGGQISATGEPGKGATFTILLPM